MLTEEQKQRIEANKRKAMALRAAKFKQQGTSGPKVGKNTSALPMTSTVTVSNVTAQKQPSMTVPKAHARPQAQDSRTPNSLIVPSVSQHTLLNMPSKTSLNSSVVSQNNSISSYSESLNKQTSSTQEKEQVCAPTANTVNSNPVSVSVSKSNLTLFSSVKPAISAVAGAKPATSAVAGTKPATSAVAGAKTATSLFSSVMPATSSTANGAKSFMSHFKPAPSTSPKKNKSPGKGTDLYKPKSPVKGKKPAGNKQFSSTKGMCILTSRQRFEVQIGFSHLMIELFKSMKTRSFDQETKNWSFDLSEYDSLIQKVKVLDIVVDPLPRYLIQTFKNQFEGKNVEKNIPKADLSRVDSKIRSALMPFQHEGVNFALWRNGRVLIADDMGLGKTIQAICVACFYREEWPLLIVVPSSVRFAWRDQLLKWVPSLDPQEINVVTSSKDSASEGHVIIMSYDLMSKREKALTANMYRVIIMDESHFLKNAKSARSKVAAAILKNANRVILLSGTPALSRPSELFVQIRAVDRRLFGSFQEYGVRYCAGKQMPWGWDFTGSSNLEELQILLEEKIMIRRLKKDVLDQLPSKVRQMILLDPGSIKVSKDMKNSHKVVDKLKGMDRRGALLQYFHETCSCKASAVKDYVLELLDSDRKLIVFGHHQRMLDALETAVKEKYQFIRIDGKTGSEQRNFFVEKFQKREEVKIAILSITAANTGLNLTAASLVVFAELFWNPGILVQAEDRAHRIGQQDSVNVQYLVATGTADDYIWPLVQQKLDVLGKAGLSKENFSSADTKQLQDPKNKSIMSYFQEEFMEELEENTETSGSCEEGAFGNLNNNDASSKEAAAFADINCDWFDDIDQSEFLTESNEPPNKKGRLC